MHIVSLTYNMHNYITTYLNPQNNKRVILIPVKFTREFI